ncbi:MAG: O-antigen ligase family protein [Actinomycetota bacterium]
MVAYVGWGATQLETLRAIAEWQFPVYLVATWSVLNSIPDEKLLLWARRTLRSQEILIVIAAVWSILHGRAGADIATIAFVIAMLAIAMPSITPTERALSFLAATTLIIYSGQRAAIVMALLPLLIGFGLWFFKLKRERTSAILTVGVVATAVAVPSLMGVMLDSDASEKLNAYVDHTFFRQAKQLSVESRFVQWQVAVSDILDRPFLEQGVGGTVVNYRDPGIGSSALSNVTHNTLLDLTLRFGVVIGLLLVIILIWLIVNRMVFAWRISSLALWICSWTVAGLLAKGMVESILFKPRLVPVLALLVGVLYFQRVYSASTKNQRHFEIQPTRLESTLTPARSDPQNT